MLLARDLINFYSGIVTPLLDQMAAMLSMFDHGGSLWNSLVALNLLLVAKEYTGEERAAGAIFYITGRPKCCLLCRSLVLSTPEVSTLCTLLVVSTVYIIGGFLHALFVVSEHCLHYRSL